MLAAAGSEAARADRAAWRAQARGMACRLLGCGPPPAVVSWEGDAVLPPVRRGGPGGFLPAAGSGVDRNQHVEDRTRTKPRGVCRPGEPRDGVPESAKNQVRDP